MSIFPSFAKRGRSIDFRVYSQHIPLSIDYSFQVKFILMDANIIFSGNAYSTILNLPQRFLHYSLEDYECPVCLLMGTCLCGNLQVDHISRHSSRKLGRRKVAAKDETSMPHRRKRGELSIKSSCLWWIPPA